MSFFPPFLPCALVKICEDLFCLAASVSLQSLVYGVLLPAPLPLQSLVYCLPPLCPCKVWYSIPGNYIQPSVFNLAQNVFYWPRNIGVQEFKKSIKNGSCQYDSGLSLGNSSETFPPKFLAFCWLAANESTKNHQGKPWFAAIFERQQKYQPTKENQWLNWSFNNTSIHNCFNWMTNQITTWKMVVSPKHPLNKLFFFWLPSWIFKRKFTKAWSLESDLKREMTDRSRQAGFRA